VYWHEKRKENKHRASVTQESESKNNEETEDARSVVVFHMPMLEACWREDLPERVPLTADRMPVAVSEQ
jgi:hypothetical protein